MIQSCLCVYTCFLVHLSFRTCVCLPDNFLYRRIFLKSGIHSFLNVLLNDVPSYQDYTASVTDEWINMEHWWYDTDRGIPGTRRKTYPSATLSTINLPSPGLESNTGLHGERWKFIIHSTVCLTTDLQPLRKRILYTVWYSVAVYVFFLIFPSLQFIRLYFLQ
jgi:hypothetical protein